ncbi:3D domain-containing protein [Microaceticoccus formicicus]|uniref:3D domain-containing protein n=1 Tax=Microaceticoccus formicicus TaxID=3118105 RepID=UPI003CD04304|nr:3D domain-containing protein [Peptoniphilaceae bacterium AMB_02]
MNIEFNYDERMIYLRFGKYSKIIIIVLIIASLSIVTGFTLLNGSNIEEIEDREVDTQVINSLIKESSLLNDENKLVSVYYKGKEYKVSSIKNLKESLEEIGIKLSANDLVFPSKDVDPNSINYLLITNYEEKTEEVEKPIPFETIETQDDNILKGEQVVNVEGEEGLLKEKVLKVFRNGKLISEKKVSEEIIKPAVNKEVAIGTKEVEATNLAENHNNSSNQSSDLGFSYSYYIDVQATAYDASVADGIPYTATGTIARPGVIAVDPSVIPLGTRVYIESLDGWPSYGYAVAEDTGSAIVGHIVDLFYDSHQTALDFGRRSVRVYILD